MALDITRLSGGNTPADGSDPRTFPAIWNATSDALEADVIPTDVTSPATGQLLQYDGTNWVNVGQADAGAIPVFADAAARTTAIPSPSEGMVTYREDDDLVEVYNGASFVPVGPGQILQVVSTTKTDTFSTASTSYTDITGLGLSITPSSTSSKIMLLASVSIAVSTGDFAHIVFEREGTLLAQGDAAGSRNQTTGTVYSQASDAGAFNYGQPSISLSYLDSPATTSATEYFLQLKCLASGAAYINRSSVDTDNTSYGRSSSTFTLMEVAG